MILVYGSREGVACLLKIKRSLTMETKSTSVVKDPCIDNKQLEISIAKQDSLCSPSDMLKSYQLNAVLFSKERTKTHFKL